MAKKIVSILCALAMLATMVTVGMVSAFAGEGDTGSATVPATGSQTIDLLDTEHLANWGITRQFTDGRNYAGKVDFTQDSSLPALEGITGALVHEKPNVWSNQSEVTSGYVRFDYNQPMNFGSDFSILMTDFIQGNVPSTQAVADTYVGLTLGDYSVRLVRFQQDATDGTSGKYAFRIALYVKNELYACSNVLSTATTTSLYDGAVYSHDYGTGGTGSKGPWYPATNYKGEMTEATGEFSTYILQQCLGANDKPSTVAVMFGSDAAWKDIKIVFKDGNLQVLTANDTVCNFAVVDTDFTGDVTTLADTDFDTPSINLSDKGVTSFNGVTPSVTLQNDKGAMNSAPTGMFRLKVTVNTIVTENLLDSTNIEKWEVKTSDSVCCYAGAVNLTGQNLVGVDGVLALNKSTSSSAQYATFAYADAIDFGADFSILMTAFIKTKLGTKKGSTPPTVTEDTYVSLALGDYSVRLVRFTEDAANESTTSWDRCSFRIALYQDSTETLLAVTDIIDAGTTTTLYNGIPYDGAGGDSGLLNGAVSTTIANGCQRTSDNKTAGKVAYSRNSGWKDITVTVKDGKLSVSTVAGVCNFAVVSNPDVDVTTLTDFIVPSLDIPDGTSFDGIKPVVRCYNDGALMKLQPSGVFRLEATITTDEYESDTRLKPYAANTTVNSALSSNMLFTLDQVKAWENEYNDVTVTAKVGGVVKQTISKEDFVPMEVSDKLYQAAKFDFLTPDLYGTTVEYVVSATTKDGTQSTYTKQYSIKDYCVNMMNKELAKEEASRDTTLGKLCMSILQFAEAERTWAYNETPQLSTVDTQILTVEEKNTYAAFAPTGWTSTEDPAWKFGTEGSTEGVEWVTTNLNFKDEIGFSFYFTLPESAQPNECYVVNGSKTYDNLTAATVNGTGCYNVVARISATQLDEQFTFFIKNNANQISETFTLSVKDWVLAALQMSEDDFSTAKRVCVTAMMTYGDAAKAYKDAHSSTEE